jgi:hypothetical protein
MKTRTKALLTVACALLLVVATVFGTVAYLTAKTDTVTNTFTVGKVGIDLDETTTTYNIVPGVDIAKDPAVTVDANSEDSWVFVKVEESTNWADAKVSYTIADGWTQGDGTNIPKNVYYREYGKTATDKTYAVLKDNKVTVSADLTSAEVAALTTNPTLSFTAYAVQKAGLTAAAAWAEVA